MASNAAFFFTRKNQSVASHAGFFLSSQKSQRGKQCSGLFLLLKITALQAMLRFFTLKNHSVARHAAFFNTLKNHSVASHDAFFYTLKNHSVASHAAFF